MLIANSERMSVYEVPEAAWPGFCERFSREHRGKRVTVAMARDADDLAGEREIVAQGQSLAHLGVVTASGSKRRVVVTLQGTGPEKVVVPEPERIRLEQHGERAAGFLRIDAAGSPSVLLCFDEPLVPGILNGLP